MKFTIALVASALLLDLTHAASPDGPNQQCADDAGPPWEDDGPRAYYVGFPNRPVLRDGVCTSPVKAACEKKGALAAHLDGPIDCGGRGWFCRIVDEPGHRAPGHTGPSSFPDSNFASCNQEDTEHDRDGHCHGSDADSTYGWWVRDHWHRNYAGSLKCCCGWGDGLKGVVNRCDYRKPVTPEERETCRDANEEHTVDMEPGCTREDFLNYKEPPADQCWEVKSFAPGTHDGSGGDDGDDPDSGSGEGDTDDDEDDEGAGSGSGSGGEGEGPPNTGDFLLYESFDKLGDTGTDPLAASGWKIRDAGKTQGPSDWAVEEEEADDERVQGFRFVEQSSNIRTRERHSQLGKLGTELVFDSWSAAWENVSFGARVRSRDNDMLGLTVRRRSSDGAEQLRVSFDRQRRRRGSKTVRVVEFVEGKPSLISSAAWRYERHRWYDVEVQVVGQSLRVYVDGNAIVDAEVKAPSAAGGVALYSFANRGAAFAEVQVQPLADLTAPVYKPRPLAENARNALASTSMLSSGVADVNDEEDALELELEDSTTRGAGKDDDGNEDLTSTLIIAGSSVGVLALAAIGATALYQKRKNSKRPAAKADEEKAGTAKKKQSPQEEDGEPAVVLASTV